MRIKVLCVLALVILAVPMFGASYIKFDGVDGESKAGGHQKWIEIESVQFEGGACNLATRAGAPHHASIGLKEVPEALVQACTSQKRFASAVVDVDGRRHTLQNVLLSQCPTPTAAKLPHSSTVVIRLDFATCSEDSATAGHVRVFDGNNGVLIGLSPTPVEVKILKTTLRGKTATIKLVPGLYRDILGRAPSSATAKVSKIDSFTIKQTTTSATYTFSNAVITSFVDGPEGPTLTFDFDSMTGSPADFQRLGEN